MGAILPEVTQPSYWKTSSSSRPPSSVECLLHARHCVRQWGAAVDKTKIPAVVELTRGGGSRDRKQDECLE